MTVPTHIEISRGAEWRLWDLHIHSPASYQWKGQFRGMKPTEKSQTLDAMIEALNTADPIAFAIMDYWTFDGYLELRKHLAQAASSTLRKTIFPGLELRCNSPQRERLNIHVVLSDELTEQQLSDFKSKLSLIGTDRPPSDEALREIARGLADDKLQVHGKKRADLVDDQVAYALGAEVAEVSVDSLWRAMASVKDDEAYVIVPFDTYGGLKGLQWDKHPVSATVFMTRGQFFEVRRAALVSAFQGIRTDDNTAFFDSFLQTIGHPKPPLSGSDAHEFSKYGRYPQADDGVHRRTWIKADPTFHGLRQVRNEPAERVYIGERPPKLQHVEENPTRYIRSVEIRKKDGSQLADHWFDTTIPLNTGLVAIIGNKGSGKSALADIIALMGDVKRDTADFSFLHRDRFRLPSLNYAKHFQATITWADGESNTRGLDEDVPSTATERVRYLPQSYLEKVCSSVDPKRTDEFRSRLEEVIFSHIPDQKRLECATLRDLIDKRTAEIMNRVSLLRSELGVVNAHIVDLENKGRDEYRAKLASALELKQRELRALDDRKPPEVLPPQADPTVTVASQKINDEISLKTATVKELEAVLSEMRSRRKALNQTIESVRAIREELRTLEQTVSTTKKRLSDNLQRVGIDFSAIVSVTILRDPLDTVEASAHADLARIETELDQKATGSAAARLATLTGEIEELRGKLTGPQKRYQEFLRALDAWTKQRATLVGDASTAETITFIEAALDDLTSIPARLRASNEERNSIVRSICAELRAIVGVYADAYAAVAEFTRRHPTISNRFSIEFKVGVWEDGFVAKFFNRISHGAAGSFYGVEQGRARLEQLVKSFDFSDTESAVGFPDAVLDLLRKDVRSTPPVENAVERQLKSGVTLSALYDFLFSLEYLQPRYSLSLAGKDIQQLSPGERGALLLVFYLLVDRDEIPLIIDQPEENLDNQTVFELLGQCIREAKHRRQIIMVTHNPNLAIACDAEQIIYASIDKKDGNRVRYESGSIENPPLNAHAVNVLEGTPPAFLNRGSKYHTPRRAPFSTS